ncbi:MAG: cell division protein FtsQ/DivIB [Gammaproteobacteria bacterium]|jgi:cell division protein FtsQ
MNSRVLTTGLETHDRAPEAAERRRSGLVLVALLLLLSGFGAVRLMDPQTLPIRHVKVQGEFRHLSLSALQARAAKVVSGGFFNVNVKTIQRVLLGDPWISAVTVKRVWPDRINVLIREQRPVARWNETGLLNADGDLFTPDPDTLPDGLPRFRGPAGTYPKVMAFYNKVRALLPPGLKVAAITLSKRRAWRVRLAGGPLIRLGRMNIVRRVQRFARHVPTQLHASLDKMQSVDMRYTNGFAVQWKPDHKPDL